MELIYEFDPERFFLGSLCKRNHDTESLGFSLRYCSDKTCVQCAREKSARYGKAGKQAAATAKHRQRFGRPSRAKGADGRIQPVGITAIWTAIRHAGRCPSVAKLVMNEQRQYWQDHPEAKKEHDRQWRQAIWWLDYQTKPELRLYTRQKSKRRKALERGSVGI
jgi:hypothetical protein